MKIRFVAKQINKSWGVYDIQRGSWPVQTPELGLVKQDLKTEAEAQAEADRLTASITHR